MELLQDFYETTLDALKDAKKRATVVQDNDKAWKTIF